MASNQVRSGSLLRCMTMPAVTDVWRWQPRAFPREWLGLQLPALAHAAGGANEAIRPPQLCQMPSTGDLIRKSTVKAGPGHRLIMLPAASHVNIIGTSAPPSTQFYAHSVYWLCHRNERQEPVHTVGI